MSVRRVRGVRGVLDVPRIPTVLAGLFAILLVVMGLAAALPATAEPPCAIFDTCKYLPNPNSNGPLLDTWNVPGTYGGWTTNPLICDPITRECRQAVPRM